MHANQSEIFNRSLPEIHRKSLLSSPSQELWNCTKPISINLFYSNESTLYDRKSFVTKELSLRLLQNGTLMMKQSPVESLTMLKSSFALFPNILTFENMNWMFELLGAPSGLHVPSWFENEKNKVKIAISEGRRENSNRNYKAALAHFEQVLTIYPYHPEALFLKCSSLEKLGQIEMAINFCSRSLLHNPIYTNAMLNLASFYQRYGRIDDSIRIYEEGVEIFSKFSKLQPDKFVLHDDYVKMASNLALAYFQQGNLLKAISQVQVLSNSLQHGVTLFFKQQLNKSDESYKFLHHSLAMLKGNEVIIRRSACFWESWEVNYVQTKTFSLSLINSNISFTGPLLPFDTLLFHIPLIERFVIARAMATTHLLAVDSYHPKHQNNQLSQSQMYPSVCSPLKIGFISYDFNDHPTARLIEGIFRFIHLYRKENNNSKCEWYEQLRLHVYSYGRNDGSSYRWVLENLSDKFVDLVSFSHEQSAAIIMQDRIDLLFEMQLHTLGNRLEITAMKPCSVIINYLVYPGTSGASFIDYLFADYVVVPVEQAHFYSESIVYVEPSYQISYYDENEISSNFHLINEGSLNIENFGELSFHKFMESKMELRRIYNLPLDPNATIFCNFNKADKIEPMTFSAWMNILRNIPNSYLWLLKPTSEISEINALEKGFKSQNDVVMGMIYQSALFHGISPKRILFAERVAKQHHIGRHFAADIFLDTFIYGAHSTATDALKGGLPVLTILGDSFPNRVVGSLYESFFRSHPALAKEILQPLLLTHSIQQYEEHAIKLSSRGKLALMKLQLALLHLTSHKAGVFDSERHVKIIAAATQAMKDTSFFSTNTKKKWNILVSLSS